MSKKHIIILAVMALADICVLGLGAVIVLTGPQAAGPAPAPVAIEAAAASPTPPPSWTATAMPTRPADTPAPTETHWATWTPRPTRTSFPTNTFTPTPTPTNTSTPTQTPTRTPRPTATPKPAEGGGSSGGGGGGAPSVPGNVIKCGTPNGRPTNGKLDALVSVIAWRQAPDDRDRAIGTLQILASGGGDCYKYNFIGKDYDYEPIEFEMGKCGCQTAELIVTSADGQRYVKTWNLCADAPEFKCK
jgi:hypothetical protein